MKRFFILASAVIVALASCSKTEVVYKDAPQEIGFKAVTGTVTKAEIATGTINSGATTLGVFAYLNNDGTEFFENAEFTYNSTTASFTGGKYWPFQNNLDFVVYAPKGTADYTPANKTLTVEATNVGKTKIADQVDYLYAESYSANNARNTDVAVNLKHALSKVTLSFTGENVKLLTATIDDPTLSGKYSVDYAVSTPVAAWTDRVTAADLTLSDIPAAGWDLNATAQPVSILVVPADDSDIILTYKVTGSDVTLTAKIELTSSWAPGTHYTYNVKMNPELIEVVPTAVQWTTPSAEDKTL